MMLSVNNFLLKTINDEGKKGNNLQLLTGDSSIDSSVEDGGLEQFRKDVLDC